MTAVPADGLLKVCAMFQMSRHLFHRQSSPAQPHVAIPGRPAEDVNRVSEARHPAMRGLNVSPVHGRHCICDRCGADRRAA